jgi:hypothetical protein
MKKFRLESIIIDHARQPKQYHTHFIIFLLGIILFCLVMIILQGEM